MYTKINNTIAAASKSNKKRIEKKRNIYILCFEFSYYFCIRFGLKVGAMRVRLHNIIGFDKAS